MDARVFFSNRVQACSGCGTELGRGELVALEGDPAEAYCLSCADLDHLTFLSSGNAALTRRAVKHSAVSAVVWKFSRSRKRNERQGVLVDQGALERAEEECLADEDLRARRRARDAERRAILDSEYLGRFAAKIRDLYPSCPPDRATEIALHACEKHSGRVGRSAAARELSGGAVDLAVRAHVRHVETGYDGLLARGYDRRDAREFVRDKIEDVLSSWRRRG